MFHLGRYALTVGAAAALLAGCGGSQPLSAGLPPSSSFMTHFAHAGSWIAPNTSGENLIYMALYNSVGLYDFHGKQVGSLQGFQGVDGLCSDPQGNVWVTYGDSLLEYSHGGTIPIAQLYTPGAPHSCAVDPTTGNIAVTEGAGGYQDNVAVFDDIYGTPQTYTDPDIFDYEYCTYDDQGNLFVNGNTTKVPLAELPKGGGSLSTITQDHKIQKLGGLQWDGQYLATGDSILHVIYQLSVANGHATTETTTSLKGWHGTRFKTTEPFAIYNGVIVLTLSDRQTGLWKFPAGGKSIRRIGVVSGAKTISVAPSALRRSKQ